MKIKCMVIVLSFLLLFAYIGDASAKGIRFGSSGMRGLSLSSGSSVRVKSHLRKDGTFVMPHSRTAPNATIKDNWGTFPNVNPYTGKTGTIDPYSAP
jgi:hypothetical protein